MNTCACAEAHETRRVVLTGGPGAGKTAVLEMVRHSLCRHVRVLPEAASIVFGGGFPREDDLTCRRAEQRAIYFAQRELEVTGGAHTPAVLLCDRGTLDGLAYWPGPVEDFLGFYPHDLGSRAGPVRPRGSSQDTPVQSGQQPSEPAPNRIGERRRGDR